MFSTVYDCIIKDFALGNITEGFANAMIVQSNKDYDTNCPLLKKVSK